MALAETRKIQVRYSKTYIHCWCSQALEQVAQEGGTVTIPEVFKRRLDQALGAVV